MANDHTEVTDPTNNRHHGFADRLKIAMAEAGDKSPAYITRQIGGSLTTVKEWIRGRTEPTLGKLVAVADCLGVSVEWLATGEGPMRRDQAQFQSQGQPQPQGQSQAPADDPDAPVETIGDRLKYLHAGTPISVFARQVHVPEGVLTEIEADTRHPDAETIALLTGHLGIRQEWLLTGEEPMYAPRHAQRDLWTPDGMADWFARPASSTDAALMGLCMEGLRRVYRDLNARIDDRSAGELAARIYDDVMTATAGEPDPEPARRIALRLALAQLRRDLTAAPSSADARKHPA